MLFSRNKSVRHFSVRENLIWMGIGLYCAPIWFHSFSLETELSYYDGNKCTGRGCNFIYSISWQSWVIREFKALLHFAIFRATCLAIALEDKLHEALPIVIYTEQMKILRDKLQKPLRKVEIGSSFFNDFNRLSLDHARCEASCTKHLCSVTASLTMWQFFCHGLQPEVSCFTL